MKDDFFQKMNLPISTSQETLETISSNKMRSMFDPKYFEVRTVSPRDKGVDFLIEVKVDGKYTNFHCAVQLKATSSIKSRKRDKLIYPVEVKNIEYLLNYGKPSYYIIYDSFNDDFFIETVNEVYKCLIGKYKNRKKPKEFSYKFSKNLTPEEISKIHAKTVDFGKIGRDLGTKSLSQMGIVIDDNNCVYSVEENVDFIEEHGISLINKHEFMTIIEIERRSHPRGEVSPMFNLVCGVAYYQMSNLFKAIELLKLANENHDYFEPQTKSLLVYTLQHVRYLLGIISKEELKLSVDQVTNGENIGSFLQLEKAYNEFVCDNKNEVEHLYQITNQIIESDELNFQLRIIGYARLLEVESQIILHDLTSNLVLAKCSHNDYLERSILNEWSHWDKLFTKRIDDLAYYSLRKKAIGTFSNIISIQIEWVYSKIIRLHVFNWHNNKSQAINGRLSDKEVCELKKCLGEIDRLIDSNKILKSIENTFYLLKIKFEIFSFMDDTDSANNIVKEMRAMLDKYEMNAFRPLYDKILQKETRYNQLFKEFADRVNEISEIVAASDIDINTLRNMNDENTKSIHLGYEWTIKKFLDFNLS